MIKLLEWEGFIFEEVKMEKHQEKYLELIEERFDITVKPRIATYKRHRGTIDSGIVIELSESGFSPRLVFLSDNERNYFHKWAMELDSEHLPTCVWLTRYSDSALSIIDSFFI